MKFASMILTGIWMSAALAASTDPYVHWRMLRTPHFEIIYTSKQRKLADIYGVAAEQAYAILSSRFSEMPSKTYLVLLDNTDETNGLSTFLPYPMIQVYPALPDSTTTLDYYGNWPLTMVMHEFTHILTFEPSHGFYVPLRYVFGSVIHPNGILPHWYLEGLAVESESRLTDFGRLKSPRTDAELRGIVQDSRLRMETIDRLNESLIPEYPYGERPYLFGSILWEHMMKIGPPTIVDNLNQDYGRRFPFFLNGPAENYFGGSDYAHLLKNTYEDLEIDVKQQIQKIEEGKKEVYRKFTEEGSEQYSAAVAPDGHSLIYLSHGLMRQQIRLKERSDKTSFADIKSKKIYDVLDGLRLSWFPDSHSFVFDQIDEMDHYHDYHELYRFEMGNQHVTQLTYGLRAQEPSVSPDGHHVVFVANNGASQWLGLLDVNDTNHSTRIRHLYRPPMLERLSHPDFVSESLIAFTHRNLKGQEHLRTYDLKTGKVQTYFPTQVEMRHPKMTSIGLLVATTHSGVQNMAIVDLNHQTIKPVTNTTTEIQMADWDGQANELIATRLTGSGRRLVATDDSEKSPPHVGHLITADWPKVPQPPSVAANDFQDESYQPIEYLWPRYWIPFVYPVYNGVYVQGATTMSDPAGINTYTASLAYDTVTNHGSFGIQYVNSSLPPDIELSYVKAEDYLGASGLILDEQTAIADLAFYLPGLSRHWKMSGGYIWDQMDTPWGSRYFRNGSIASLTYSNWNDPRAEGSGTIVGVTNEEFVGGTSDINYNRTVLGVTQGWAYGLPAGNRLVATFRSALAPDLPMQDVVALGDASLGADYLVSLSNSQFLFRGYPNGTFVGRKVVNWNLEYQLPLSKTASGWGTFPAFSRGWDLALFTDGISVDGGSYNSTLLGYQARGLADFSLSTGAEARWNSTLAYNLPITWIFGLYFGFDRLAGNDVMPFLGLAMSDLSILDHLQGNWFKRW